MKYYVRTTNERELKQFSFLNPTFLIDTKHEPVKSFISQLKKISNENCVFMEDDILFCEDFQREIEKAINEYPNKIINFFYRPMVYMQTKEIEGKYFIYNQCVYYPKGIAKMLAEKLEELLKGESDIEKFAKSYDQLQGKALNLMGIDFISYRPCLIQHIGQKSILGNSGYGNFQTPFFLDDIKNLNYANTTQMVQRLNDFLDSNKIPRIKARIILKRTEK